MANQPITRRALATLPLALAIPMNAADNKPPVAKTVAKSITQHGETRNDPYFWLRDKTDPETIAYLEAENRYREGVMEPVEALQKALYTEMVGRTCARPG